MFDFSGRKLTHGVPSAWKTGTKIRPTSSAKRGGRDLVATKVVPPDMSEFSSGLALCAAFSAGLSGWVYWTSNNWYFGFYQLGELLYSSTET